jgi:predicted permease
MNSIGPGYFATLSVPVIAGRDFRMTDSDRIHHGDKPDDTAPRYVIINEKFAKKYLAGQNPLGRHAGFGNDPGTKTDMEIIGVVKDIKYTNLRDEIPEQMFVPYVADEHPSGMTVYLRTTVDPAQMFSLVRSKVHDLDANLPVYATRSMEEQLANSLVNERMIATLSVVFGFLATILAAIGLYGVMAYSVERRGREIGIRMALGAVPGDVIWLVMREVLMLSAIGLVAGLAGSLALTRYVQSQLYGVHGNDWTTMGAATVGLAIVASAAGLVPALRASHADPMQALRYE